MQLDDDYKSAKLLSKIFIFNKSVVLKRFGLLKGLIIILCSYYYSISGKLNRSFDRFFNYLPIKKK